MFLLSKLFSGGRECGLAMGRRSPVGVNDDVSLYSSDLVAVLLVRLRRCYFLAL